MLSHKFNDHNLRLMDIKQQLKQNLGPVAVNQVHRSALSIGALQYKLGHFDAALQAIYECIKIAQSKNDDGTVLDATLWLHQIIRALGGKQERLLVEHMIQQSIKSKNTYIMVTSLLNFASMNKQKQPLDSRLIKVLKEYKCFSDGGRPIWNDVLMIVQAEIVKTSQKAAKKQVLEQFKQILML